MLEKNDQGYLKISRPKPAYGGGGGYSSQPRDYKSELIVAGLSQVMFALTTKALLIPENERQAFYETNLAIAKAALENTKIGGAS